MHVASYLAHVTPLLITQLHAICILQSSQGQYMYIADLVLVAVASHANFASRLSMRRGFCTLVLHYYSRYSHFNYVGIKKVPRNTENKLASKFNNNCIMYTLYINMIIFSLTSYTHSPLPPIKL